MVAEIHDLARGGSSGLLTFHLYPLQIATRKQTLKKGLPKIMTKKLLLLLIPFLVVINASHGQTAATPATTYPIGPIYYYEYYGFLHDINAPQNEPTLEDVEEKFIGNITGIKATGSVGNCSFDMPDEFNNNVLATAPSKEAQELFNTWQENPTSAELFNYLDDQVKVLSQFNAGASLADQGKAKADALNIKNRYPSAPLYPPVTGLTVFDSADWVAQHYAKGVVYVFVNELNDALVTIPGSHMLDLKDSLKRGYVKNDKGECVNKGEVVIIGPPYLVRRVIAIKQN
jgi:hypothetical protein